ncbi:RNA polymerase sigma-70 factor, sigma-E family [Nakamurella panacisegetis]|uniref:RNA polymerase sigma-70 factor, sigma-E family n=1 Tax=Nakamurella panacisegetis TaxID=1090615 RepID=A0A1H0RWB4_9ACTN|nr:SigE family RNA polymerase sigma factor [Nakamurella panacisegetis]SDP33871.1 RNA polymerase sigma-70 factor, sigma-E family [Nakamurella panacisegetis]
MTAEGFEEYARAHRPGLVRAAYLLTGDAELAEDLVQATLLRVWQRWARVSTVSNVDGYVYQVMFTRFVSWRRRLWSGEHPHADVPEGEHESPDVASRLSLEAAIRLLPPRQRAVLILRYYLDLTETDAAEAMGCSVGTVKSQSSRALAKLRATASVVREQPDPIQTEGGVVRGV